mgnify:CR=1 FL=1
MKIEAIQPMTVVKDIRCDICGSSVVPRDYKKHIDSLNDFSAYAKLHASFGYGSTRDGEEFNFDFCEDCFDAVAARIEELKSIHASKR